MNIQLSDHFTYKKLIRFTLPSIAMMIFTSIYGVVDGIFVSNFVGKTPFAALNLIMPCLMIFGAIGFMLGAGGSALVAKTLGEGDRKKANRLFSMLIYVTIIGGTAFTILGLFFLRPLGRVMGAEGEMLEYCVKYGRIILIGQTFFMLQNIFQSFFITAEKPNLALAATVAAGMTNIVLDALFVAWFKLGLEGAAFATILSQAVGGIIPLVYFTLPNKSLLRMTGLHMDWRALLKAVTNGSSELMSNISMSLVGALYNFQLLKYAGEDGVAAYGVIMYVNFIFVSIFVGYAIGSAPLIGYNYGAQNHKELQNLRKKSLMLISIFAAVLTVIAEILASPLSRIFVSYDSALLSMTERAFMIYSLSFLVMGFNIFGSSFFTALNNGPVSAAISFLRTLICQIAAVMLLPIVLGLDGIWWSVVIAELMSLVITGYFYIRLKKDYYY